MLPIESAPSPVCLSALVAMSGRMRRSDLVSFEYLPLATSLIILVGRYIKISP